jgi:hypothetical protein
LGVSVALPLLDSMVPAQTPLSKTAATSRSRLSCIYVPHGATMDKWTPAAEGKGFESTEILARSRNSGIAFRLCPTWRIPPPAAWVPMPAPTMRGPLRCF